MKAKDLAKILGVSPATISLVLNNKPGISDSLRKSLLAKIEELGHTEMLCESCRGGGEANKAAESLPEEKKEGGGCKLIAYLIFEKKDYLVDFNDPYNFFAGVLEGVEAEAWENDCCLVVLHMNKRKHVSLAEQLRRAGNVMGVIVHHYHRDSPAMQELRQLDVPVVFTDAYNPTGWEPSSVCISNRQGMKNAIKYLYDKGHREIGYVYSGWEHHVQTDRRKCFQQSMKDFGLADRPENYFCSGTGDELLEYQRLAKALEAAEKLPTALMCENDRQAWRTIKALRQIGKRIPEDVSVVGFDDQQICLQIEPNITSVHNSPQLMGRQCVIMLKNLVRLKELGEEEPWLRYELPARLTERGSVRDISGES